MSDTANMPQQDQKEIITWLQNNAIPIEHIEAGNGFADLQPLKTILQDVKIVGLGETTHGTHETLKLRQRLMEFLVTEMGFTMLVVEGSFATWQPINDYILYGKGDRADVLTGQWYVVWDTEEMTAMLDWLRSYNQTVADERKVQFYGVDVSRNGNGRKAVLEYLRKVKADKLAATETLFESLAAEEAKWPRKIDAETENNLVQLFPHVQGLIDYLTVNKDQFINRSSRAEYDLALQYTHVMKQWMMANATELLPSGLSKATARSTFMAENLVYLVDQAASDAKFIVFEHNWHLSMGNGPAGEPNMGSYLRGKYGQSYRAYGVEFNQGSFNTRLLSEGFLGDLKEVTLQPAAAGTLAWYLAHLNMDTLIVNLHAPVDNPVVEQWLNTPITAHHVNWVFNEASDFNIQITIGKAYDGIIFFETTSATHPTANALKTLANRDGL